MLFSNFQTFALCFYNKNMFYCQQCQYKKWGVKNMSTKYTLSLVYARLHERCDNVRVQPSRLGSFFMAVTDHVMLK